MFKVTADSIPATAAADPDVSATADRLKTELSSSLVEQYVDALKQQLGVTIDRRVLARRRGRLMDVEALYAQGRASVLTTTLVADLETPVSAYLKLAASRAGDMFLLESVEGGAQRGRYSMIGLDPDLIFRCNGAKAEINRRPARDRDAFEPLHKPPLEALRDLLAEFAHRPAGGPAADVGRRVRLSRLRHGAADGAAGARQARPDRRAGGAADPPDGDGGVRQRARRDGRGRRPCARSPASARAQPRPRRRRASTAVVGALEGAARPCRRPPSTRR